MKKASQSLLTIDQMVGRNLRALRLLASLTQQDVANELGITFQQVQKYEKGSNRLSAATLLALKNFYNVPFDRFFQGLDAKNQETAVRQTPQPLDLNSCDEMTIKLICRVAAINNLEFKSKLGRLIEVLAPPPS